MTIEIGFWRLEPNLRRIEYSRMDQESKLEQLLAEDVSIVDPNLLVVGRQVPTSFGKFIDLLAIDGDGNLVVVELKRNRTPREVVAQLLDYGSWVRNLKDEDIAAVFDGFLQKFYPSHAKASLDEAFCERFGVSEMPESLNESHELVVVAGELDESTERIINYLAEEYGVAINAVFFRFFRDGDNEYLSRAWLIDPAEAQDKVVEKRERLPWNGEFYVSFGGDSNRDWEEARKYGFVSAGGGSWYSTPLHMLEPGSRIWVTLPGIGYVGVGKVAAEPVVIDEFMVDDGTGKQVPIASLPLKVAKLTTRAQDPEKAEHMVRVEWTKTVPASEAAREKGFFAVQNSAAKPRAKSWQFTVDRLRKRFEVQD